MQGKGCLVRGCFPGNGRPHTETISAVMRCLLTFALLFEFGPTVPSFRTQARLLPQHTTRRCCAAALWLMQRCCASKKLPRSWMPGGYWAPHFTLRASLAPCVPAQVRCAWGTMLTLRYVVCETKKPCSSCCPCLRFCLATRALNACLVQPKFFIRLLPQLLLHLQLLMLQSTTRASSALSMAPNSPGWVQMAAGSPCSRDLPTPLQKLAQTLVSTLLPALALGLALTLACSV